MEDKYSFQQKQIVINNLVKKKIFKQHVINIYSNIEINNYINSCLYCNQILNNKVAEEISSELKPQVSLENLKPQVLLTEVNRRFSEFKSTKKYCSLLCQNIYISNLYFNINQTYKTSFVPLCLLTDNSQNIFINLINLYKTILYDKFIIHYILDNSVLPEYTFKKLYVSIDFIKKYKKIATENLILETIIFKINKNITNNTSFFFPLQNSKHEFLKKLPNLCLYCNDEIFKPLYVHLANYNIIGKFCSVFCCKVFLSFNEQHLHQQYKYFFQLPPINYFKDKTLINTFKKKNNNIIYNVIYHNENNFDIIETLI